MVNSIRAASLALFGASASALSVGSAHVVNQCNYDVFLFNVPASGGGFEESDTTLSAGASWSQPWTQLSNGDGWSIKLAPSHNLGNILQYEYTFHNDGIIWYDLSCVNGNPWDKDWEIIATTDRCSPKQQAYRYATDDAYGMQSCGQDASIKVTLCSGQSVDNGTAVTSGSVSSAPALPIPESPSSSAAAPTTQAVPSSASSSSSSAPTPTSADAIWFNWNNADASASNAADDKHVVATPTTFVTSTTAAMGEFAGVTVMEVETAVVTDVVTAIAGSSRVKRQRHEHHVHAHQHNAA